MALTFTRTLDQPVTSQTINTAATYTSAEQDIGANTIAEQIWLYLEVAGFAAAPGGNEKMIVEIQPIHTTAGTGHTDDPIQYAFTVTADQAYYFALPLASLPRFFDVAVTNDTGQNTDASAVQCRIEYIAVTV
jgi:hypothetical protein